MRKPAAAIVLMFAILGFGVQMPATSQTVSTRFMAYCTDGDGPISEWVNTRNEAYLAGRDHERGSRQHHWEVWTQQGETVSRPASCAVVSDGTKPDTVKVENNCTRCVKFFVSRTNKDGSVKSREFTISPKKSRHFRKLPDSRITVDSERDCPE
jgi:hypothetical protein